MSLGPDHEPSAWLRGMVADALRHAAHLAGLLGPDDVMVAPLTGRSTRSGSREDRCCDRCGTYVPEGPGFHLLVTQPTPWLLLCGGLCAACAALEVGA
ncbi:hypothetical protein [Aestuariimicrobium sp. Y1814]|uniref:hypothetical protein n=1 Tax=Aestuariimicrobium sp. Y1814 TaxID=3418742 RepID=UPI003DA77804